MCHRHQKQPDPKAPRSTVLCSGWPTLLPPSYFLLPSPHSQRRLPAMQADAPSILVFNFESSTEPQHKGSTLFWLPGINSQRRTVIGQHGPKSAYAQALGPCIARVGQPHPHPPMKSPHLKQMGEEYVLSENWWRGIWSSQKRLPTRACGSSNSRP